MSSVATGAIAAPVGPNIRELFAAFWSDLSARFYRFLNNLPEGLDDVDPEVFKRVPVPV